MGHRKRLGVSHCNSGIDYCGVVCVRPEVFPYALDKIRTPASTGVDGVGWVCSNYLHIWILFLEESTDAGNCASGACPSYEVGDFALSLFPDLRTCCQVVSFGICLVVILIRAICVGDFCNQAFRCGVIGAGVFWRYRNGAYYDFGSVCFEECDLFTAYFVGHDKNAFVASLRCDYR